MALMRVDTVFPMFTGQPEDIVMNTLHFETTLDKEQLGISLPVFLTPFWQTIYGTNDAARVGYIAWQDTKYRVWDLSEPSPRVPYEEPALIGGASTGDSIIPTEVAIVASFRSQGLPGEVYQRRYNRIFLGMLPEGAMTANTQQRFPIVNPTFQQGIVTAMENLAADTPGPSTLWVQVSGAGTPNLRTLPVIGGWVDNSPDTQRRRSVDATDRLSWSVPE